MNKGGFTGFTIGSDIEANMTFNKFQEITKRAELEAVRKAFPQPITLYYFESDDFISTVSKSFKILTDPYTSIFNYVPTIVGAVELSDILSLSSCVGYISYKELLDLPDGEFHIYMEDINLITYKPANE